MDKITEGLDALSNAIGDSNVALPLLQAITVLGMQLNTANDNLSDILGILQDSDNVTITISISKLP